MNRPFNNKLLAAALAALTVSFASCVKEEWEDCLDMRLLIETDQDHTWATRAVTRTTQTRVEDWYECIDSIDVYVFDENRKFVTVWTGGAYDSTVDYEVPLVDLRLPEGVYTFVAWTHCGDNGYYNSNLDELLAADQPQEPEDPENPEEPKTRAPGDGFKLEHMLMHMQVPENGDAFEQNISHRHHGILHRAYVSNNSILDPLPATIEISPSIHKVNFDVTGIHSRTSDDRDDFTLTVIDSNTTHDFSNQYIRDHGEPYRHIRPLKVKTSGGETRVDENTVLTTSMHLMQLDDNSVTRVEIHNDLYPDEPIHVEENLRTLIQMAYGAGGESVNFDETLEFDIEIDLRAYPTITFIINGWVYIRQRGEI
jgi:hypothetical protein